MAHRSESGSANTGRIAAALGVLGTAVVPGVAQAAWEMRDLAGMSVEIYTPESQSPIGEGRALMIPLHGCSQTAVQLRDYGNFEHTADELGVVVAIPLVPGGGVFVGCWDYYGSLHTRTSGHNGNLIELAETMRDDSSWNIDPAQIYVAGLSSGGGQALVVGCLAPELFAGIGVVEGPALGTSVWQISQVSTTAGQAAMVCTTLAGSQATALGTQLAVTFTDTGDFTVAQGYATVNAEMFAMLYGGGAALTGVAFDMAGLPGTATAGMGNEYVDADGPRLSAMISSSGVGHAWPSGSGVTPPGLTFVSGNGLDFGRYLVEFFTANNRRVSGSPPGDDGGGDSSGGQGDGGEASGTTGDDDGTAADYGGTGEGEGEDEAGGTEGSGAEGGASASAGQDDRPIEPSGCQCTATPEAPGAGMLGFVVLAALARRRGSGGR